MARSAEKVSAVQEAKTEGRLILGHVGGNAWRDIVRKHYRLKFEIVSNDLRRLFETIVAAKSEEELQGIKEERAMYFEKRFNSPVFCVSIEEV